MARYRIAVVRGGPSAEHDVSLKTGKAVLGALSKDFEVLDIVVDRSGIWHHNGFVVTPESLAHRVDAVFNAMHGEYGEDGKVQRLLDAHKIPYTGSSSLGAAVSLNKAHSKDIYKKAGIKSPYFKTFKWKASDGQDKFDSIVRDIFTSSPMPGVAKPIGKGSSVGVRAYRTRAELESALANAFGASADVLVEELIEGIEATCGVLEGYRGDGFYVPPVVEVRVPKGTVFDYESKYTAPAEKICPACVAREERDMITEYAKAAHKALGLRDYSRSDFMIHPKRGVFILETNALPGLTETSLLPHAMLAVGCSYDELVAHIVSLALKRK